MVATLKFEKKKSLCMYVEFVPQPGKRKIPRIFPLLKAIIIVKGNLYLHDKLTLN